MERHVAKMRPNVLTGTIALLVPLVPTALLAHHSLANYDTTTAVRVKGTVVQFQRINPHSLVFVDETRADGTNRRWAVEGPSLLQLDRSGFAKDGLKPGDAVEVCGYLPKEPIVWQVANPDSGSSTAGRLLNGETLTTPDGQERSWGDYGVHKCFAPGHRDQHSR